MSASKIISLAEVRRVLAERFPEKTLPRERAWETGWAALDADGGRLKLGAILEVCGAVSCGRLFLDRILAAVRRRRDLAVVIEVGCSLDARSYEEKALPRMLGVFCQSAEQAVKAADLLLRDGNLTLVLLDLQSAPRRSLGGIPASTWHRFQRLVEKSGTALVVLTPQPMVEAARVRLALRGRWDLAAMRRPRADLIAQLELQIFHRGRSAVRHDEPIGQTA